MRLWPAWPTTTRTLYLLNNMGIPYRFDPLGTLGAANELPFVQPLLEKDGSTYNGKPVADSHGSFGMWSKYVSGYSIDTYTCFDGDESSVRVVYGGQKFKLIFERPVKIVSLVYLSGSNNGSLELYIVNAQGDEVLLGKNDHPLGSRVRNTLETSNEIFSTEYIFKLITPFTFSQIYEIYLNAFYKP